jgi:hypothetical protein
MQKEEQLGMLKKSEARPIREDGAMVKSMQAAPCFFPV